MEDQVELREHVVVEDRKLESILDAIDDRTVHQQMLHNHISDGFMALARERYVNPSSSERLGRLVYDNREDLKSSILVKVEESEGTGRHPRISRLDISAGLQTTSNVKETGSGSTMRRRKVGRDAAAEATQTKEIASREPVHTDVRNRFMAIPSRELCEAIKYFRLAVDQAVEVANATRKVEEMMQNAE